jgi:hypothetical protein
MVISLVLQYYQPMSNIHSIANRIVVTTIDKVNAQLLEQYHNSKVTTLFALLKIVSDLINKGLGNKPIPEITNPFLDPSCIFLRERRSLPMHIADFISTLIISSDQVELFLQELKYLTFLIFDPLKQSTKYNYLKGGSFYKIMLFDIQMLNSLNKNDRKLINVKRIFEQVYDLFIYLQSKNDCNFTQLSELQGKFASLLFTISKKYLQTNKIGLLFTKT